MKLCRPKCSLTNPPSQMKEHWGEGRFHGQGLGKWAQTYHKVAVLFERLETPPSICSACSHSFAFTAAAFFKLDLERIIISSVRTYIPACERSKAASSKLVWLGAQLKIAQVKRVQRISLLLFLLFYQFNWMCAAVLCSAVVLLRVVDNLAFVCARERSFSCLMLFRYLCLRVSCALVDAVVVFRFYVKHTMKAKFFVFFFSLKMKWKFVSSHKKVNSWKCTSNI